MVDRLLSAMVALALMVGGLVVAVEIVGAGLGRSPWLVPHDRWAQSARTTTWSDPELRVAFVGLILGGALLLVVEWGRRRPEVLLLAPQGTGVAASLDRREVERWLVERVRGVEGVSGAQVRIGHRRTSIDATSVGRDAAAVKPGVREVASASLESLGLERPTRLAVNVRTSQERR